MLSKRLCDGDVIYVLNRGTMDLYLGDRIELRWGSEDSLSLRVVFVSVALSFMEEPLVASFLDQSASGCGYISLVIMF
jgi:hypothetical protein